MRTALAAFLFALCLSPAASAQIGGVQLPQLPGPATGAVEGVTNRLPDARETLDTALASPRELVERREELTRDLIRQNRHELEADPRGFAIARSHILALDMSAEAQAQAQAAGFEIVQSDDLGDLGAMVTLRAPARMSTRRALERLRQLDPNGAYDFDHLHWESSTIGAMVGAGQPSASATGPRIGLIDSGVAAGAVAQRGFVGANAAPGAHGTQVAQLIAQAAPGARIYAADIYGGSPTGGGSSALTRALAWLAAEQTPVINISLVGPRNAIVEASVARLVSRGFVVVAAVGNDGPAAAPLFPAAYPGVIGVTGVDARERVLMEAGRGAHVDVSALGIVSPRVRGTSYAAPLISGVIASRFATLNASNAERALQTLQSQARDLGARGRDDVYGYGLVAVEPGAIASR